MARANHRGFAAMDSQRQREIASRGGRAAHQSGKAHEFDSREAREAGRRGGDAVSRDRQHMAEIGSRGGRKSHSRRRQDAGEGMGKGENIPFSQVCDTAGRAETPERAGEHSCSDEGEVDDRSP